MVDALHATATIGLNDATQRWRRVVVVVVEPGGCAHVRTRESDGRCRRIRRCLRRLCDEPQPRRQNANAHRQSRRGDDQRATHLAHRHASCAVARGVGQRRVLARTCAHRRLRKHASLRRCAACVRADRNRAAFIVAVVAATRGRRSSSSSSSCAPHRSLDPAKLARARVARPRRGRIARSRRDHKDHDHHDHHHDHVWRAVRVRVGCGGRQLARMALRIATRGRGAAPPARPRARTRGCARHPSRGSRRRERAHGLRLSRHQRTAESGGRPPAVALATAAARPCLAGGL